MRDRKGLDLDRRGVREEGKGAERERREWNQDILCENNLFWVKEKQNRQTHKPFNLRHSVIVAQNELRLEGYTEFKEFFLNEKSNILPSSFIHNVKEFSLALNVII